MNGNDTIDFNLFLLKKNEEENIFDPKDIEKWKLSDKIEIPNIKIYIKELGGGEKQKLKKWESYLGIKEELKSEPKRNAFKKYSSYVLESIL
ncbi:MAG: hypothetical protein WJU30_00104 [Candidatus Phytoplasma pruni]